jgi:hypothetical protein
MNVFSGTVSVRRGFCWPDRQTLTVTVRIWRFSNWVNRAGLGFAVLVADRDFTYPAPLWASSNELDVELVAGRTFSRFLLLLHPILLSINKPGTDDRPANS